jgi:hypothetical protein
MVVLTDIKNEAAWISGQGINDSRSLHTEPELTLERRAAIHTAKA